MRDAIRDRNIAAERLRRDGAARVGQRGARVHAVRGGFRTDCRRRRAADPAGAPARRPAAGI
eukprot:gene7938-5615_t